MEILNSNSLSLSDCLLDLSHSLSPTGSSQFQLGIELPPGNLSEDRSRLFSPHRLKEKKNSEQVGSNQE